MEGGAAGGQVHGAFFSRLADELRGRERERKSDVTFHSAPNAGCIPMYITRKQERLFFVSAPHESESKSRRVWKWAFERIIIERVDALARGA